MHVVSSVHSASAAGFRSGDQSPHHDRNLRNARDDLTVNESAEAALFSASRSGDSYSATRAANGATGNEPAFARSPNSSVMQKLLRPGQEQSLTLVMAAEGQAREHQQMQVEIGNRNSPLSRLRLPVISSADDLAASSSRSASEAYLEALNWLRQNDRARALNLSM